MMHRLLLGVALFAVVWGGAAPSFAEQISAQMTLLRNQEYQEALLKGIREARKSIVVASYLFKATGSHRNIPARIVDELVKASRRGIEVTVILERNQRKEDNLNRDNLHTAALLNRGGVKVFFDSPQVTTHVKVAVIDRRLVFLGSHNLTQSALQHNNELSMLVDSPQLANEILEYLDRI